MLGSLHGYRSKIKKVNFIRRILTSFTKIPHCIVAPRKL